MYTYSLNCKCGFQTVVSFPVFSTALTAYCRSCGREAEITFLQMQNSDRFSQKAYIGL